MAGRGARRGAGYRSGAADPGRPAKPEFHAHGVAAEICPGAGAEAGSGADTPV